MLLGSTTNNQSQPNSESLIIQLLLQQRYAEAYDCLIGQQPLQSAALYNMALCLHWAGNYESALSKLENIQLAPQLSNGNKLNGNGEYVEIRNKQNETNDYLHGLTEVYIKAFPSLAHDAIIRLKTDCWLKLRNYDKVRAIATPIASKGYKNITDALKFANTPNDERI